MKKVMTGVALLGAVALLGTSIAVAQEEGGGYTGGAVSGGGSVSGKVTFKGTRPEPKKFDLKKFPNADFCAKISDGKGNRELVEVKVGKDGALSDVVVYIEGITKGKEFKFAGTDVEADACQFLVKGGPSEFVGVVMKKADIRVKNNDADPNDPKAATGVLHNPHGYEVAGASNSTTFNVPLAEKGAVVTKKVVLRKKESQMKLECDQHNYMNTHFLPVSNPYYAIVGADGTFTIDQIPPGDYEIEAWHPILGKQEGKVSVAANGKATANFTFSK